MRFGDTVLKGLTIVDPEPVSDERGSFARVWCANEFSNAGLSTRVVQVNVSTSAVRGTLRGMHYQAQPHAEIKIVRCTSGAVFDVAIDLRPDSPTFRRWQGVELTAASGRMVYIPQGMAHGFQTLTDDATLEYQMSEYYAPEHARGVRWNDPAFGVNWPLPMSNISPRDAAYPDFVG